MSKKDDEKLMWLLVGCLFSGALIGMDLLYSSFGKMSNALQWITGILHALLVVTWVIAMVKFKDPNYDSARKMIVGLCVVLALIVGIHHASSVEDTQVIIDSQQNAAKP